MFYFFNNNVTSSHKLTYSWHLQKCFRVFIVLNIILINTHNICAVVDRHFPNHIYSNIHVQYVTSGCETVVTQASAPKTMVCFVE